MSRFACISADPPWAFKDLGSRAAPSHNGKHYNVQTLSEICGMAPLVDGLAAKDAFLFLWAPNSIVLDGTADLVIKKWGFVAKQLIPWVKTDKSGKPRLGIGHYTRVCTEQLILARRGKPKVKRHNIPGVIIAPRGKHSAKPDESYQLIESLVDGEYLELYARRRYSSRWTCWGNQLEAAA